MHCHVVLIYSKINGTLSSTITIVVVTFTNFSEQAKTKKVALRLKCMANKKNPSDSPIFDV